MNCILIPLHINVLMARSALDTLVVDVLCCIDIIVRSVLEYKLSRQLILRCGISPCLSWISYSSSLLQVDQDWCCNNSRLVWYSIAVWTCKVGCEPKSYSFQELLIEHVGESNLHEITAVLYLIYCCLLFATIIRFPPCQWGWCRLLACQGWFYQVAHPDVWWWQQQS